MENSIAIIEISDLSFALIPVSLVLILLYFWSKTVGEALYGFSRMLGQLLIIGYFLTFLFNSESSGLIIGVLSIMVLASSWIALRAVTIPIKILYPIVLISILFGGGFTLWVITQGVLGLEPWYSPRSIIPLAGMIFGSSMNSISLAAERFETELKRGESYELARNIAFRTALIPITNSLFAVGLVSLPGMMTGQILSGVDPLIAVRYQIMVMCMLFASSGISAGLFLHLIKSKIKILTGR